MFTSCGLFKPIIDPFWSHGLWSDHSSNAFLCVLLLESRMFSASKPPPYVSQFVLMELWYFLELTQFRALADRDTC